MTRNKTGVLVMSYGTPESLDQIEEYYTHIRRGRPPSAEQLQELESRYEAIVGGFFPLRENTNKQVAGLERVLNEQHPDREFVCYQGLKHAKPYIEDGVAAMVEDGIQEAVGIVLAPHYSVMSVGSYIKRAKKQAEELGIRMTFVESYHLHPKLIDALTERVEVALSRFSQPEQVQVLFTAHSLPEQILKMNDPYVDQLLDTSKAIVARTGLKQWQFAWQSAGQTSVPWLGPDILDVLNSLRQDQQITDVLICPIGFVSDHLEVLYDIDIECQTLAKELGMHLERTESLNVDPLYMATLAESVWEQLQI